MKRLFLFVIFFCSIPASAQPFEPVNDQASPEARDLLAYLYKINDQHILAGQHNMNEAPTKYAERVREITGHAPALWGTDFIGYQEDNAGPRIVKEAIDKYKHGYLVTLMWHVGMPMDESPYDWDNSIQGEISAKQWQQMTTPGTKLHARWQEQVDGVAKYLKKLRDAGVPVLWRPYHEMNGTWFWWGDKKGKEGYAKLWKMMYDRFVNHHHLNNLIWVWNANAPRDIPGDRAYDYADYYPGSEYVDVLATDVYHSDYEQKDYKQLLELADGKIIALGEVGTLPSRTILEAQSRWTWFMDWANFIEKENSPEHVKDIYNAPFTLTHDDVNLQP